MERLRFYLFFLVCMALGFTSQAQSFAYKTLLKGLYDSDFPVVHSDKVAEKPDAYTLLDTRERHEYAVSHLPGARWVGYDDFSLERVAGLDKSKPVVVYCTVGARSQAIGKQLQAAGFQEVYNLYGGIIHWANEEQTLVKGEVPTKQVHTYSKSWGIWLKKGEKVYE
ncbi:rhodanese-like protein [Nitritalea halalkaliphila LW7]|uniref:Rhodanese-like protein n=1 Tax=Nitritalea halalkaliphila LW7 TaxID=1189621 RepID=I5C958_9BACT|nr:rhodanese-like domain-containing protein [Nitritalea halalkaliphila]EIM78360.1 rhodanese-like protein [Nitritalea halalkaliphila LW7]